MSTMTQILDEMEPGVSLEMLVASSMMFGISPDCGHVSRLDDLRTNQACEKCGANVPRKRILFSSEDRILEMICENYRSEKSKELCVLLFCSLVEQHLLKLLKSRCVRLKIAWPVMELLLEGYQRVDERLNLFEGLTGISVKKALAGQPVASVLTTYETLRRKRNSVAHGVPGATYEISDADIKAAVNAAADSFSCFAFLHNKYCAVDSPSLPSA